VYAGWGASHFAELWYVFDHLNQEPWRWTAADRRVAEEMSSYWVNFAKSGNPNGRGLPEWPAFTNADGRVLSIGDPITAGGVANINSLSVFDAVYTAVRGKPFAAK
jgi:para-nitrobenzyl esterase